VKAFHVQLPLMNLDSMFGSFRCSKPRGETEQPSLVFIVTSSLSSVFPLVFYVLPICIFSKILQMQAFHETSVL
jgi:hypothetical protein